MSPATLLLFLGLSLCHVTCVFGQTFNFAADPFTFEPSCGLENLNGNWSAQGTLTITAAELAGANPQISIQTTSELCTVDISKCNVPPPSTIDACYCTGQTGDVYTLFVRRRARSSQSGATLTAVVIPSNPFLSYLAKTDIGTLPLIYNTRTASLQVDGCSPIDLPTNQNVPVSGSGNVTLKFCVANLLPGYTLTISVAGQTNTNTDGCLELTVTQPITVEVATLSYVETDGCGRTDSYRVTLTNTRTASLQVDGGSPIDLPTNQNVSVSGSANVALRFCVENLLPGYTLTISVAGLMETSNDGCVDLTVTQPIRAETATLSYVGCGRKDSYRVTLTTTGGVGRPSLDIVGLTVILCVGLLLGRL